MFYQPLVSFANLMLAASGAPIGGDADPMAVAKFFMGVYRGLSASNEGLSPMLPRQGEVIMYNPQTHSASVRVRGEKTPWACVFADERISYSFGYSETCPPREGDLVVVMRTGPCAAAGIVVGRLAYPLDFTGGDKYKDPEGYHRRLFTQLEGTGDLEIPCFSKPIDDKKDVSTHIATNFRPTDVYPGEFARVNQHNCGVKGGLFSTTLLGGGASLRLSALKNSARLACEEYLRHTLHGSYGEFHNGRFLSSERNLAMYQEERLGGEAPDAQVWTGDAKAPSGGENQTMRPRMKDLTGYFGHLSSKFCFRPDPNEGKGPRVQGKSSPIEAGVGRETIDPSGQYRLSAAGMIAIERTGRIPVPVRNCYPTDAGHDVPTMPKPLSPFKHKDGDPSYRQLELFDRQAYDLKNQYARMEGFGTDGPADYDVPQEDELEPLEDVYDGQFTKSQTVMLKAFDKRRAGVYIGEDGSVIMRDAWGSEIVMLGGNVQISCAGNVMLLPGKTQLTIAGDDIVQKAQNSVDIHASEHDVRVSAARNMEILGGGDESGHSGGVLIESRGTGFAPWDGEGKGESATTSGITIRSSGKQGIVVDGAQVLMRSRTKTSIVSGDKEVDGTVSIGARDIRARADRTYVSSGSSALSIAKGAADLVGKSVGLYADSELRLHEGQKVPVPLTWSDIETNMASVLGPSIYGQTEHLADEKKASLNFGREDLDKMRFGFRSSEECGTTGAWTIGAPAGFRLYEPAWVQVKDVYETLKNKVVSTAYREDAKWENGKPFPGESADEDAKYVTLSGMKPKNLTEDGFNKRRDKVEEQSDISTDVLLKNGYQVRGQ